MDSMKDDREWCSELESKDDRAPSLASLPRDNEVIFRVILGRELEFDLTPQSSVNGTSFSTTYFTQHIKNLLIFRRRVKNKEARRKAHINDVTAMSICRR